MQQVFQTVQTFLVFLTPVVCLALVYFLGRIRPIGRFYAMLFIPPGKITHALSQLLTPYSLDGKKKGSKYPGLRTIVLTIALALSCVALTAESYNTLQAVQALWGDTSLTLPS